MRASGLRDLGFRGSLNSGNGLGCMLYSNSSATTRGNLNPKP